ncbi:MAG: phytanoyl-CoA dioxygenase family protein [Anaerolineales bacterium]|nr:phytanoyl-CoA dioxygenase family protein [Anaerolineales bacterium]
METLVPFIDSSPILHNPFALRERMEREGFFYFKRLLPREAVLDLRRQILSLCARNGWLDANAPLMDGIINPVTVAQIDNFYGVGVTQAAYADIYRMEAFHRLAQHPNILGLMERLAGEPVVAHPRNIARVMFPTKANPPTPPHQDHIHIQGTQAVYTCWIPLGDTTESLGGLQVLGGTHTVGILPVRQAEGAGGRVVVLDGLSETWSHGDFEAGDALVFHSLTVHRSVPNQFPDRVRLSVDYRYQPVSLPIEKNSLLPHLGVVPSWDDAYAGWTDQQLQYYWKQHDFTYQDYDTSYFKDAAEPAMSSGAMDAPKTGMAGPMMGGQMGGGMSDPMGGMSGPASQN